MTLVPRETNSKETVLKNRMTNKKVKPSTNTSNPEEPESLKMSMHDVVVSSTEYWEKISKAKADEKKSKIFKRKIEFQDKKKHGIKGNVNEKAKTTVTEK